MPPSIVERIAADQKAALRSGDRLRVSTLRLATSELVNRRIELGKELDEEAAIEVLAKALKQRRESESQYREAGRDDLADREAAEAAILEEYLPAQLDDAELDALVEEAIAEAGATGPGDIGAVMGRLMPRVRGRADGRRVSEKVRERLS